ncbi:MAG: hypothetical protein QOE70_2626 [Chthoniobacter sp.]|jgi:hypothetical protein|nr:hypothetical protein [Chthoniobacter sp.]
MDYRPGCGGVNVKERAALEVFITRELYGLDRRTRRTPPAPLPSAARATQ